MALMAGFRSDKSGIWAVCVVTLLLACTVLRSEARDYYVAPTGRDLGNNGSLVEPFATIRHALSRATSPGDTVMLREGVYTPTDSLWMGHAGNRDAPITLAAFPGERPVIDGLALPPDKSLLVVGRSHIVVAGLELRNATRIGVSIWGPGSLIHDVVVRRCVIHGCQRSAVFVGYNQRTDPVRDVLVESNVFYDNARVNASLPRTAWPIACGASFASRVMYRDNRVFENFGEGIGFYLSDHCVATGNVVFDNFSVNIYLDNATDCLVEGNRIHATANQAFFRFGQPATGVQIANEDYGTAANPAAGNTIVNNVISGVRNALYYGNYQRGGGLHNTAFVHNTVFGTTQTMLLIDSDRHSSTTLTGNIFCQLPGATLTAITGDPTGLSFHHNLWHGGHPQAIATGRGDILANPQFADPLGADGIGGTADDDLRLTARSPAIDAGDNAAVPPDIDDADRDGDRSERLPHDHARSVRFVDDALAKNVGLALPPTYPAIVDLGAYEFVRHADFEPDGDVDAADLAALARCIGGVGMPAPASCVAGVDADLDNDGDVDLADVAALARGFTGPHSCAGGAPRTRVTRQPQPHE